LTCEFVRDMRCELARENEVLELPVEDEETVLGSKDKTSTSEIAMVMQ
jgi:hypothetical protein